ncbi:TonB-linked SusC/RagA family outer membrane protein [Catalinimonas alkaloidigena]|uniref:SusC/RagA family TonB-linked outer membrane protein n=1 Tax=Catalinimonas alkaloidigena TaxID=1075417 RepID=UPI0024051034|nr:SusC/RagA family TonB-linked outer membrane protein [Catalinimonas alkaloidigena]MDF9796245.1 TonB-linked SusC/RagA family outer membrane protein [Catalinimonas alkaloidigena]
MRNNYLTMITLLFLYFSFGFILNVQGQANVVSGKVTSGEDNAPLPGVNVIVKGTTTGSVTDIEGNYSFSVPDQATVIVFSSIGYAMKEVEIGGRSVINVSLMPDVQSLSEVVVTAFGIEREKKALGYAAQELEPKALEDAREVNVANFLTGKVAGVQVTNTASGTGGSSIVTIRGNSSLTGDNQPLYVVDGVPIDNSKFQEAGTFGGNDFGDGIGNLNPEDIKSISVLKGPNASALYGSRGSNGVILITTKSGRARKGIGVEINSNVTSQRINLIPNVQNKFATGYEGTNLYGQLVEIDGKQYETMEPWHGDSWGPPLDGRLVVNPFVYPGEEPSTFPLLPQPKDNIRDFWENGLVTNNSIALTGGNEKSTGRLSFGNTTINGITPKHHINQQTVNLRATTQLTSKLSFDAKVNYIHKQGENTPELGSTGDNVVYGLSILGRYVPLDFLEEYYNETGDWGRWPGVQYNPYYVVNELTNTNNRDRIIGFAEAKYQFNDWLSVNARTGIDFYTEKRKKIWPVGARGSANNRGRILEDTYFVKENNSDILLTAADNLSDNFSASFSVGASLLTRKRERTGWDARNFKAEGVYDVSNTQDARPSYYLWQKEMQSVYFMGQIGYKNYLFLDVTGRNDWSSALGKNNYSFFYPSVSTSFVFTDAFEIESDILTFGKIRASYAQVGNDSDPYLTQAGFNSYTSTFNGQSYASMSSRIPLFDLKNELTESIEFGTDIRLFNNRFGVDVTYYDGRTKNQILPVSISNASGYSTVVVNAGEIRNSGLEVSLNTTPVQLNNSFRWDLSFNFAKNRSTIVDLAPGIETYLLYDSYPNDIEARPGEAFGNIIGYKYKRSPDGQRIVNSGGTYEREAERSVLGNITPDWTGGLNNTFSFKGFTLNALIDFVQGGELTSSTKYQMVAKGTGEFTLEGRRASDDLPYVGVLDGVVEVTDEGGNVIGYEENTKAVDGQTYWANRAWSDIGEEFVLDASYIMLREVILGYNFQPSFIDNTPFTGIRISLVGRNLWYIEEHMQNMGISPESAVSTSAPAQGVEALSMPTTRSFGVNVNLTF